MGTFYVTTAIDYVNARPHLGHAYEKVAADIISRWKRLQGEHVFFLTGTDENAQKNVRAARDAGKDTTAFVNEMTQTFQELCRVYHISNDDFIRTTEARHAKVVGQIVQRLWERGDIYKGMYHGLYCEGCEAFYTEKDAPTGRCPEHKRPLQRLEEENYFFRLSKYQPQLIAHIRDTDFVLPASRKRELLNRLKEPLKDLSISRHQVQWGIPLPFDRNHAVYVWVDALVNYISGLGYPGARFKKFWPADLHLIGVGITWFHAVIWPAILLSAGLPLPKKVFVHGYLTTGGEKMSKSIGNVVDPLELARRFPVDAVRYYLIRDIPFGEDGDFSEDTLRQRLNGELLADLGNLASRILTLAERHGGPFRGKPVLDGKLDLPAISGHMDRLELHLAQEGIFRFVRACNLYITGQEPWKKQGTELAGILYNLLEALRIIGILLSPFLPETAEKIARQLGVRPGKLKDAHFRPFGGKPKKGEHLFEKAE